MRLTIQYQLTRSQKYAQYEMFNNEINMLEGRIEVKHTTAETPSILSSSEAGSRRLPVRENKIDSEQYDHL